MRQVTIPFCFWAINHDVWAADARRELKECGINEVSIEPSSYMPEKYSLDDVRRLRELLDNDGINVTTSHPPFGSFNQRFSTLRQSKSGLEEDWAYLKEFLVRCSLLGVKAIPLHTGGAMLPDAQSWEIDSAYRYVEELLPVAENNNVIIAVENTNHATAIGFYPGLEEQVPLNLNIWKFDDTERILEFVHSFDSPYVKVCYDTGHSHLLGRMLPDFWAFYDDIVMLHLHDNDEAGSDAHIQPGYGNSDWKTLFDGVRQMKHMPVLFVESLPYFGDVRLFASEMNALWENRVIRKKGGFYKKDEDNGHLLITEENKQC